MINKQNKQNKEILTGMSVKEAIERYGCEKKNCPHLDKKGFFFCKVIRTDEFCLRKTNKD